MKIGNEAWLFLGMMASSWAAGVLVSRGACWTQLEKVHGASSVFLLPPCRDAAELSQVRRPDHSLITGFSRDKFCPLKHRHRQEQDARGFLWAGGQTN